MRFLSAVLIAAGFCSTAGLLTIAEAQQRLECGSQYTVAPGDSLSKIARRAYGAIRVTELYTINQGVIGPDINRLDVGMSLTIPCLDGGQTETVAAPRTQAQAAVSQATRTGTAAASDQDTGGFAGVPELAAAPPPADPEQVVEIVFNKASAPKFIMNVGIIDPLFADISRVTNGRVRFVDPDVINRDARSQLELVLRGDADGAYVFNGYLAETHPLLQITMAPMMGGTALQTAIALWRTHRQHFQGVEQFKDLKLLGFIGAPPAHIWRVSDVPVTEREQLVNNNAWTIPYFEGLDTRGAQKVRAENAERIRLLDQTPGLPPATFALAHGAARAVGVWSEARSVTEIDGGVYAPTFSVFIRQDKWQ